VIALFFGMMGTVMGLMKHRQQQRVQREIEQRMGRAKATSQFDNLEVEAVGNADNADINLIKSYWLRKKNG
jgi:CheY-specific phosphatase CheX